jgi:hypothetical protein
MGRKSTVRVSPVLAGFVPGCTVMVPKLSLLKLTMVGGSAAASRTDANPTSPAGQTIRQTRAPEAM